ncbi:MAG: hypothetical protein WDM87_16530 [Terracidiphilus sp.]
MRRIAGRATSDLTVNYGVAWDVETPNKNEQFKGEGITCFRWAVPRPKSSPADLPVFLFPGDPGCNTAGGATTKYNHFGPRLGFAWSPSGGPRGARRQPRASTSFSVRMGFGMYFNRDAEEGQLQNLGDTPNFLNSFGAADFGGSPGFVNPFADVTGCTDCSEPSPVPVHALRRQAPRLTGRSTWSRTPAPLPRTTPCLTPTTST